MNYELYLLPTCIRHAVDIYQLSILILPRILRYHYANEREWHQRQTDPSDQPFQLRGLSVQAQRGDAGAGSAANQRNIRLHRLS